MFVKGLLALRRWVKLWTGAPVWAKPAIGGLVMAAIGLAAPQTLGIGYPTMSSALVGSLSMRSMASLGGAKLAATVASYGWGLSGGIFSPTLYIGAMFGGATGAIVQHLVPAHVDAIGSFALVGMGAFFAGAVRAPITSILIIFEMTGDYAIILPLMISNVLSYTIAARLQSRPIYDALLAQDGVPVTDHETHRDLRAIAAEQVMTPPVDVLPAATLARDAARTWRLIRRRTSWSTRTAGCSGRDSGRPRQGPGGCDGRRGDTRGRRDDLRGRVARRRAAAARPPPARPRAGRQPGRRRIRMLGLLTLDGILGAVDRAADARDA